MRDQMDLPLGPPRRVRYGQAVTPRPEDAALYRAVLALRRAGDLVYRSGAAHKVGDRLVTTQQLLALAEALPRR
ncbi:MAG: hypothetical protein WCC64_02000 [Aliidongia sp.]|jgi:hypothetical protein